MAVTQLDIDEQALSEAMQLSGARTKQEAVNLALRTYVARHRRIRDLDRYAITAASWDYEGWREHREQVKRAST